MSARSVESCTSLQQVVLARRFEVVLELEVAVEVVFDGALAAAGDDEDVGEPGAAPPPRRRTGSPACRRPAASPSAELFVAGRNRVPEPGGGDHGLTRLWRNATPPVTGRRDRSPRAARAVGCSPRGAAMTSTASAASDHDLPQRRSPRPRPRSGTAPSRAATRATPSCSTRATTNHTTAEPERRSAGRARRASPPAVATPFPPLR